MVGSVEDCEVRSNVRNVVLVGRTGDGKSATGNSILLRKAFKSMSSSAGVTTTCELQTTASKDGLILNVIDTPGLFHFSAKSESSVMELMNCLGMVKDGLHAVLLVLSVRTRFTREDRAAVHSLINVLGEKVTDYMIVVFTGGDDLEDNNDTLEGYLGRDCPEPLKDILEKCGNRRVLFNNKTKDEFKKSEQLNELLLLVKDLVDRNHEKPYTNYSFLETKKDQTAEIGTLDEHSTHEEQVKGMMEMVKETTCMLEQQLEDERKARLDAEVLARDAEKKSTDEIRFLTQKIERVQKETNVLRGKKTAFVRCTIL